MINGDDATSAHAHGNRRRYSHVSRSARVAPIDNPARVLGDGLAMRAKWIWRSLAPDADNHGQRSRVVRRHQSGCRRVAYALDADGVAVV